MCVAKLYETICDISFSSFSSSPPPHPLFFSRDWMGCEGFRGWAWGGVGAMVYFPVCLLDGRIRIGVYNLALGGCVNERSRWCLGGSIRRPIGPTGFGNARCHLKRVEGFGREKSYIVL